MMALLVSQKLRMRICASATTPIGTSVESMPDSKGDMIHPRSGYANSGYAMSPDWVKVIGKLRVAASGV